MKKFTSIFFSMILICGVAFAQEAASEGEGAPAETSETSVELSEAEAQPAEVSESEADEDETEKAPLFSFISNVKVGGFFNFEPAVGPLREFVSSTIGGGLSVEAGIPLLVEKDAIFPFSLLQNFGVSFRAVFDGYLMKETHVDSIFSMRYSVGAYTRINIGDMFAVVPNLDYGLAVNLPKVRGEGASLVKKAYADQMLQIGCGVRFAHEKVLNRKLEFDLTPTYTLCPESGTAVHYLGFRFGALYSVK